MKLSQIIRNWNLRRIVCGFLLVLELILMVQAVFMVLKLGVAGKETKEVIIITLEMLCLILGVFLFAGASRMKGASSYYLLVVFLLHVLLSGDLLSWILEGYPEHRGTMLSSMYFLTFADCFLPPAYLLMLRQMAGMGSSLRDLLGCRDFYDRAETVISALGFILMAFLFLRNFFDECIFSVSPNSEFREGRCYGLFFIIPVLESILGMIRLFRLHAPLRLTLLVFGMFSVPFLDQFLFGSSFLLELDYPFIFFFLFVLFGEAFTELCRSSSRYGAVLNTYVYNGVSEHLLSGEHSGTAGKSYTGTVLSSDLRGFTALSEGMSADDTAAVLNHYMGVMMRVVTENGGTIAEFLGDGLLCVFGAPVTAEDHADRALQAAELMQQAMEEVNQWNRERGCPEIRMGIGISSGRFLFGSIGTSRTARLMALGTPVDEALRACAKAPGGQILITGAFREEIKKELPVQEFSNDDESEKVRYYTVC